MVIRKTKAEKQRNAQKYKFDRIIAKSHRTSYKKCESQKSAGVANL